MLTATDLHAYYGRAHILQGVSFALAAGEVLVLLGRNGAGKSTTMKSLIGLVRPRGGALQFAGHSIAGWEPHRIARAELSVAENLEVGRQPARDGLAPWTEAKLFALFPNLAKMRERPGGRMSGGEQQMLAIARTLMGNPRAILLDEPSEGLAPVIVEQMSHAILALKAAGVAVLLAEQNFHFAARVADRAAVLESGRIVWEGTMAALLADQDAMRAHLQV